MIKHAAIVGTQWGDEGKGKIVDHLAPKFGVVVRYQGGPNAGHTVVVGKERFALHLIPSGILQSNKTCVIGDGVLLNPETLVGELTDLAKRLKRRARLVVGLKTQLIMPWHIVLDGIAGGKVGTTKRGIGPAYADATSRRGIRVMDALDKKRFSQRVKEEAAWNKKMISLYEKHYGVEPVDKLKRTDLSIPVKLNFVVGVTDAARIIREYQRYFNQLKRFGVTFADTSETLEAFEKRGKRILFEGAQATLLDITHGDYPFVTSSHPTVGGLYIGTGFRPRALNVIGVAKAYSTRVGNGPFPSELLDKVGEGMRERGHEYGTTTGRPRRCGWLDLVIVRYAARINGLDEVAITKLDVLTGLKKFKVCVGYRLGTKTISEYPADVAVLERCRPVYRSFAGWSEDITRARTFSDLPKAARDYVRFIEKTAGLPVKLVGVGPDRAEIVAR